jgi:serine protease inhibitor
MPRLMLRALAGLGVLLAAPAGAQPAAEDVVNRFACSLYRELAAQDGNLFFSPWSVGTALAMTAEGARGETARQMGEVLGLDPAWRREDAQRPYDWTPMHAGLAQLAGRLAPAAPPAALVAQLAAQRTELDHANRALESATSYGPDYFALGERARALADQINRLQRGIDPTRIHSANALWLERSFALEPAYLETIDRHYRSGTARPVDFRTDPEAARRTINDWVAGQTEQRIPELLAPRMLDAGTRLVLTNAVYFLGEWLEPFDVARTAPAPFRAADGASTSVALMRALKRDGVKYAAFDAEGAPFATPLRVPAGSSDDAGRYPARGFQLLELPYRGDALSMLVLLPSQPDGLPALEARLDADALARWSAALEARKVDVALPKFRLDAGVELGPALQRLGMPRAFVNPAGPDGAQFDGISTGADPTRRLFIGAVVHRAFVQVDEKGTEAAAATAVSMLAGAALPTMVDFTPVFRADRPFLFAIREKRSGALLFLGRLVRPPPPA